MKLLVDSDVYSDEVLRRFENPPRAGWLEAPSRSGSATSAVRNAEIRFALREQGGTVTEVRFKARGCPHAIAVASLVAERLEGQLVADLTAFDAGFVVDYLALPADKLDLKILVEDAVRATAGQ
jgi:NifU-like protein involved in Fe-S cluster formation